jgi:hypothetical protein
VFDWLFGTLRVPLRQRERITFGVEPSQHAPHTITGGLITPFVRAFRPSPAPAPGSLPLTSPGSGTGSYAGMSSPPE